MPVERFVELRAHSAFSFGTSSAAPEQLVTRAAELGYTSIGLTDASDLGGVVRFTLACRRLKLRPVVGVELLVDGRPMALLARTAEGYRHLAALVTRARSGRLAEWSRDDAGRAAKAPPRGHPQVRWRDVAERAAGLTLLTGPTRGHLGALLRRGQRGEAERLLAEWREAFAGAGGETHLAVEVQLHHAGRREEALAGALAALAERAGVRWAVTNDSRYVGEAGRRAFDVLVALRHGTTLDDAAARGLLLPNELWGLPSPEAVARRWTGREAGVEATAEIAEACGGNDGFELSWARPALPDVPLSDGHTSYADVDALLRARVEAGARVRWGDSLSARQRAQIEHELGVIGRLGFAGFFLVMWDAVREAERRNILCQGRGSAANSAVAYVLGITAVDPVEHGLLFERFLSAARADGLTEAPDIDVDVEHDRREELLDYVYRQYGRAHAAIACIVQTYSAPTAVQDVCRAYGVPVEVAFALSKRLHHVDPEEGAAALRDGLAAEYGLSAAGFDPATPRGDALLRAVAAFEGVPRMRSTHPGGFVLSAEPLADTCPVEPTTMGRTILQYDKDDLDALGIPKFDFLGLGALSMVRRAFDVVERRSGVRPHLYRLPQDDPETFAMISAGDTFGTFQIESRAQISSLVHTRPEKMYDLVVQVALIRPGPIVAKFVRPYVERRRGRASVDYPAGLEARLKPILGRTQGLPIFQEQAMALSVELAKYKPEEADELRRTMGNQRKLPRLMAALETLRIRMVEGDVPEEVAAKLTEDLRSFANYGFPESHAWSFALIAYATAWLKRHEPAAFYAGLLNAQPMGFYSVSTLVHDARRHGLEVRLPCLVAGAAECTIEERDGAPDAPALRVGWKLVRGLGDGALARLTAARAAGSFGSVADVVRRAGLTRAEATALARAHAFATWEPDRRRAAWEALRAAGDALPLAPARDAGEGGYAPSAPDAHAGVSADYHALGLSVAGHPMARHRPWCDRVGALHSAGVARCRGGTQVVTAGLVIVRQKPSTAKGTVFLLLEDEHGTLNVIVNRRLVERCREAVHRAVFVVVYGRAECEGALVNVVARAVEPLEAVVAANGGSPNDGAPDAGFAYRSHDFH
ncbi:error-prone DNA polymerase [Gemmatimonadetes bacterium T265]|nr:error-prone DNA polymerase [Gemmatimonadetes bacterium T265]